MTALVLLLEGLESSDPAYVLAEGVRVATLLTVTVRLRLAGVDVLIRPGADPRAALERWTAAVSSGAALALAD